MALDSFRTIELIWDRANKSIIKTIKTASSDTTGRYFSVKILDGGQEVTLENAKLQLYWEHPNFNTSGTDDFNTVNNGGLFKMTFSDEMLTNIGELNAHLVLTLTDGTITSGGFPIEVFKGADGGVVVPANGSGLINQITNKIDKGNVTMSDLTQEVKLAMTGGSVAVVGENVVGTENIMRHAVTPEKMPYVPAPGIQSKNLFNKNDYTPDSDINSGTGEFVVLNGFIVSGFIPVDPNVTYTQTKINKVTYWDANYKYISRESLKTFTTPSNCYYARLVFPQADLNIYQLEEGTISTPYEEYGFYSDVESFKDKSIPRSKLAEKYVTLTKGKNLFNKETLTSGYYVDYRGTLVPSTDYSASDFIEIKQNTTYVKTDKQQFSYYDENKNPVTGLASASTFTTPDNVKYIRLTIVNTLVDTYQLEEGSTLTAFEPFGSYLPLSTFSPLTIAELSGDNAGSVKHEMKIILPDEIYMVTNEEFSIYFRNILTNNIDIDNYDVVIREIDGTGYKQLGRHLNYKWFWTPTTAGDKTMEIRVYDAINTAVVVSKTFTIKVKDKLLQTVSRSTIVTIGDSFTDGWGVSKNIYEMMTTDTNNQPNFIGLHSTGVDGVYDDAWSGYSYKWYTTTASGYKRSDRTDGTDSSTPNQFYNPTTNKFDFTYYMSTYQNNASVDIVQSLLGINDSLLQDIDAMVSGLPKLLDDIEAMWNSILNYDNSITILPILITPLNDLNDGFIGGYGTGTIWNSPKLSMRKVEIFNEAMLERFGTQVWRDKGVHLVAVNANWDYRYAVRSAAIKPVKFDQTIQEVHTIDIHPNLEVGSKYIADSMRNAIIHFQD